MQATMMDGVYEQQGAGHQPVVHAIEVHEGVIVRAWVYQIEGEYSEPAFAAMMTGRPVQDVDLSGYRPVYADEARARERVQNSPQLRPFGSILLKGDDEHYQWVRYAPEHELVEWASHIAALEEEAERLAADWLTPAEIAAATGTAESTWRNKAAAGEVPGAVKKGKQWLIPATTLEEHRIVDRTQQVDQIRQ